MNNKKQTVNDSNENEISFEKSQKEQIFQEDSSFSLLINRTKEYDKSSLFRNSEEVN
jgi:hypothetical protein